MKLAATFRDNPMLYKDITQWLNRKHFGRFFVGFLFLATASTLIVPYMTLSPEQSGLVTFALMGGLLFFYLEIIAVMLCNLTSAEFSQRTFELFELSGMTPEKMIRGKLLSGLAEFMFGFFAIVPFMFSAYMLGGVDFYLIFAVLLLLALLAPVLLLLALMIAVLTRTKWIALALKIAGGIGIAYLSVGAFTEVAHICEERFSRTVTGDGMMDTLKALMALDGETWMSSFFGLFFYAQLFLLVFYVCCDAITPSSDTRQGEIKTLLVTASASWLVTFMILIYSSPSPPDFVYYTILIPILILTAILGLTMFYGTGRIPIMAQMRIRDENLFLDLFRSFFSPDSWGTFRAVMTIWVFIMVLWSGVNVFAKYFGSNPALDHLFSMILQLPFFLGFPAFLLIRMKRFRTNPNNLRLCVLGWWVIWGLAIGSLIILSSATSAGYYEFQFFAEVVGLFVSPISSYFGGVLYSSGDTANIPYIRFWLGVVGIVLMFRYLSHQQRLLRKIDSGANDTQENDNSTFKTSEIFESKKRERCAPLQSEPKPQETGGTI